MGKSVKAPPSPDYVGAAQAQGSANQEAARQTLAYSNPFMNTPYGSQTVDYVFNPLTQLNDQPVINQTLTPTGQQAVEQQQQAELGLATTANQQTQNIQNLLNTPFQFGENPQRALDLSGVAKAPINAGTTAQEAILSRLNPQIQRNRQSTETQLRNQGLVPGGEAYDNAIRLLGEQENDLRLQAGREGVGLDMAANQQGFNQALQGGQFGNTAIQQALAQALSQRDVPINEITALLSGSQVQNPQFPGYQGANVAPAPVFAGTQAQGAWDQNVYNQNVASRNSLLGGLFGLAAAPFNMFRFG